ncbi:MAG: DUF177 domain-containing protein [Rhodocyclaceae bacterium]|nr:DUF177 domain-containing protein [Rhodocyclaceae bacterium]MCB1961667.1 DUF177 domain-containing protein [Rhodocyclaceae bacterium]
MSRESYTIDAPAFAREGRHLAAREPVSGFERLAALAVAPSGDLEFEVAGVRGDQGQLFVDVVTRGTLMIQCQRCLGPMPWAFNTRGRLLLVPPDQTLPDEDTDEDFDSIHADSAFALLPLIEDEVLLALPFAPRHEQCEPPLPLGAVAKESPFAVLENVRAGKGSKD